MKNKAKIIILCAVAALAVLSVTAAAIDPASAPAAVVPTETARADTWSGYILRDDNGYIAIYSSEGVRIKLTDIETDTLNYTDREKLARGIAAADHDELIRYLEDLGS